ncbi:hypothetical protein K502DRAFT_329545 [Neoconidiobolus thromboides FSU 785]|nr:hypothetical protein K502DRAFT_329545 [Neoconidiobolus thromboides FSU 785]
MQLINTVSLTIALLTTSISAECISKVNIETCEAQYQAAIEKRCANSNTKDACYCTDLPSLAACYDFCINESIYQDKKDRVMQMIVTHCAAANLGAATANWKASPSASSSPSNVALFANSDSTSGSAKSTSTSTVAVVSSGSPAKSVSSVVSSAASAAASNASKSVSKSLSSSAKSSDANVLTSSNAMLSMALVTVGSFFTLNLLA